MSAWGLQMTKEGPDYLHLNFQKWFRDPLAPFSPSVETVVSGKSVFLSEEPLNPLVEGKFHQVPLMIGINEDEGLLIHSAAILKDERRLTEINNEWFKFAPITLGYEELPLKQVRTTISTKVSEFYFGGRFISHDTQQNFTDMYTDRLFTRGVKLAALLHSRFASVYPYIFSYHGDHSSLSSIGINEVMGVAHTDELQYLFSDIAPPMRADSDSERFSKDLVRLWINFATTGRPIQPRDNGREWRPMQQDEIENRVPIKWNKIDRRTRSINEPFTSRLESWNIAFETRSTVNRNTVPRQQSSSNSYNSDSSGGFNSYNDPIENQNNFNPLTSIIQGVAGIAIGFLDMSNQFLSSLSQALTRSAIDTRSAINTRTSSNYNTG